MVSRSSAGGGAAGAVAARGLDRVGDRPAAEAEGLDVALDVGAVDLDRPQQRLLAERHEPGLPGGAEHQHVGVDRVAEQLLGQPRRVEHAERRRRRAGRAAPASAGRSAAGSRGRG